MIRADIPAANYNAAGECRAQDKMTEAEVLSRAMNIGQQMLVSGAEIYRVEDTVTRICTAYGAKECHVFSIASSIVVSITDGDGKWVTQTRRIRAYGIDLHRMDLLNELSRKICRELPEAKEIDSEYAEIMQSRVWPPAMLCMISAMTGCAFSFFFGGRLREAGCAFIGGSFLRACMILLNSCKMNSVFSSTITSIFTGIVCTLTADFFHAQNLNAIMIGNIMLLIPGVLLTNSFRDFISGDTLTGLLHFLEAVILAVCIAAGFIIAVYITAGLGIV